MRFLNWFACLWFIACVSETKNNNFFLKMEKVEDVVLKVRDCTHVNPANFRLVEADSGTYLFFYNHVEKNFHFIDFSDGKVALKVPLSHDGPNSIQRSRGFSLMGIDSIWATFTPPAIGLINFKGEVLLKSEIPNDHIDVMTIITTSSKPLLKNGRELFGPQPYFMDHQGMNKNDILKHHLVFSFNLNNGEINWHEVFYREDYWRHGKKPSDYSWDQRGDSIYIAPLYDHEVIVFDTRSKQVVDRKEVKSNYINNFLLANEPAPNLQVGLEMKLGHDWYGQLIYDKYRDLFYRVFMPGYDFEGELSFEEMRPLERSRPLAGIMVFDKDLNFLGEHLFEKFEIYPNSNMFVGEKGLYLSLNNENHPDYDEDHFRYRIVRFVE